MSRPYDRKNGAAARAIPAAKDQWYVLHVLSNKERRAVENLKRSGGTEYFRCHILLEEGICKQAESWADALSADFHHVPQRVIQSCRFSSELQVCEQFVYCVFDTIFNHDQFVYPNLQRYSKKLYLCPVN